MFPVPEQVQESPAPEQPEHSFQGRLSQSPVRVKAQGQLFRGPVLLSLRERSLPARERSLLLPQSFPLLQSFPGRPEPLTWSGKILFLQENR